MNIALWDVQPGGLMTVAIHDVVRVVGTLQHTTHAVH